MTALQIEAEDSRPLEAHYEEAFLNVTLTDGRVPRAPLWWRPRFLEAVPSARDLIELSPLGVY